MVTYLKITLYTAQLPAMQALKHSASTSKSVTLEKYFRKKTSYTAALASKLLC